MDLARNEVFEMTAKELAIKLGYSEKRAEEYWVHLKRGELNEQDKKIQDELDEYLNKQAWNDLKKQDIGVGLI